MRKMNGYDIYELKNNKYMRDMINDAYADGAVIEGEFVLSERESGTVIGSYDTYDEASKAKWSQMQDKSKAGTARSDFYIIAAHLSATKDGETREFDDPIAMAYWLSEYDDWQDMEIDLSVYDILKMALDDQLTKLADAKKRLSEPEEIWNIHPSQEELAGYKKNINEIRARIMAIDYARDLSLDIEHDMFFGELNGSPDMSVDDLLTVRRDEIEETVRKNLYRSYNGMARSIKEARLNAGLTQKSMSEMFGIPKRTIGSWEDGSRNCPDWAKRLLIAELQRRKHMNTFEEDIDLVKEEPEFKAIEAKALAEYKDQMDAIDHEHVTMDTPRYAYYKRQRIGDELYDIEIDLVSRTVTPLWVGPAE